MPPDTISSVLFSPDLQTDFATLSGDWNPLHMSPVAARRTQLSAPVVHGMHLVACCMEAVAGHFPELQFPIQLKVCFLKPVYQGDSVSINLVSGRDNGMRLQVQVKGVVTTSLSFVISDIAPSDIVAFDAQSFACSNMSKPASPRELSLVDVIGRTGAVDLAATPESICARFPDTARWIGAARVGALLCLSRLVGMECPGLHSMISGFTLYLVPDSVRPYLSYSVNSVDERIRLVNIHVDGLGIRGQVDTFVRHSPVSQLSIAQVSTRISAHEFAGQKTLIVGGSRGLGELTAKVIAAGGGHPIITYVVGEGDVERVAAEIESYGSTCEVLRYDVRLPALQQLQGLGSSVPYLYYYATPPIFRRRTRDFEPALLHEFLDFYVHGFHELCRALMSLPEARLSVFYPSSTSVVDRPRDMTEYSMAKAAGEILCTDLTKFSSDINIVTFRLPRLSTDQTVTFVPVETADSLDVLLPIIRQVQTNGPGR
jgi:hypothetical protein